MAPNIHEAFDRLKEQGKVRFLGVSTHTPNLEEVANTAIDSGRFDVMMLAYHFGMWPTLRAHPGEGEAARRRHRRDEDAEGREHADLAALPRRRRRVLAGRVPLGAVESRRVVSGGLVLRARSTSTSTSPHRARRCAPSDVAVLERYDELIARRLLPAALRPLPGLVSRAPADQRRAALPHVLRGLRLGEGRACGSTPRSIATRRCAPAAPRRARARVRIGVPIRTAMMDAHRRLTL